MPGRDYRPGDIIYLGKNDDAKITLVPMQLVALVSISPDGELWKVRCTRSGDLSDHFIHYLDAEDDPDRDRPTDNRPLLA